MPNLVARRSFFGVSMMVIFSLFLSGVLQVSDVVQHGYWRARGLDYFGNGRSHLIEWLRLPRVSGRGSRSETYGRRAS